MISRLPPYVMRADGRGRLVGITQDSWHEANYLETRAGCERGGHYHRSTRELFFIIRGRVVIEGEDVHTGLRETIEAAAGDIVIVEPGCQHRFRCTEDTAWINMLSQPFDASAPDLHVKGQPA